MRPDVSLSNTGSVDEFAGQSGQAAVSMQPVETVRKHLMQSLGSRLCWHHEYHSTPTSDLKLKA